LDASVHRTLLCGYPCRGTPLKIFLSCCHHIKCVASMGKTGILKCSPSIQRSVDRCIQVGLGCTLGHSSGGRSVAEGIDQSSYQLARDESCMECFDRVSGRESAYQM
jgi:hypothetical protein